MASDSLDLGAGLPPDVFAAATDVLARGAAERDEAFAALCRAHPEHEVQLRRLVAELASVERLLDGGYGSGAPTPTRLGPYRVLRRLGDGAFGEVFLCEQTEPVRREVAVKVLRAGAGDRTTLLRFTVERQLIASMQHPAIAQVFDAGTLDDGRPFFVMDAIDGRPIDRYCDERALPLEARLELFCDLCRGVQHAHDRGIVHRDLKPANVLVVDVDGRPRPKIIDFGIAKALQASSVARSFDTEAGRVVGTPGYMSPEQQKGASDDVDARADVFGLGVMLYELLCGQLPWAAGAAATDTDPQRPSTRLSGATASASAIARHRSTEPRRLASRLRGDLDWIVLKCLQRERTRRYGSAQELVDDLERHRRAEPVHAGPPSTAYRLKKFVRRHRVVMAALGGLALVLAVGFAATWSYRRSADAAIGAATAKAEAHFAEAAAAVAALLERANDGNVREAPLGDAAREAMLRDALAFYDRFLIERPQDPALRAQRCRTLLGLSNVHWLLGDAERATATASQAVEEGEVLCSVDPTDVRYRGLLGEAHGRHGVARSLAGDVEGARAAFSAALEHLTPSAAAAPAEFGRLRAMALRNAAITTPSRAPDARLRGFRESLQVLEDLRSIAPPVSGLATDYVLTACQLGQELRVANDLAAAEEVLQRADAQLPLVTNERLHLTCRVRKLRAQVALQREDRPAAIGHFEAALATATEWERAQPNRLLPRTMHIEVLHDLAFARNYAGEFDASVAAYHDAIAIGEGVLERFPTDANRSLLADVLTEFALTLYDRFDRAVLGDAAVHVARAIALAPARNGALTDHLQWEPLGLQALIADADSVDGGDGYWPGVETTLAVDPPARGREKDALVGLLIGLGRWHEGHGRAAQAAAWLQRAEAVIATDPPFFEMRRIEAAVLSARLAFARADHAACAVAAERALAARSTWYGMRHAADCFYLASRCAEGAANAASEVVAYRDRAMDLYREVRTSLAGDVEKDGTDPWYVLPWSTAVIRIAQLSAASEPEAALGLLDSALPRLDAVRAAVPADQGAEQLHRDGRALRDGLAAARR